MVSLVLVPTPIGNLEDITLRARRVLAEVDGVIAEDTRVAGRLLQHLGVSQPLTSFHVTNEHRVVGDLLQRMIDGERLALISDAGTPGISDPGFLLVREAVKAGLGVECLPGPTAFVPALVMSGLPCERFVFEGFLPQKKGRQTRLRELKEEPRTMVFYEAPHRLVRMLGELIEAFGADRAASISREISKMHEETQRGTLQELSERSSARVPKGEFVICVAGKP
jgi:16S rRNA (cytidine1402-2'-O)-methyltransferase